MGARIVESGLTAAALVGALSKVSANAVPGLVDALLLTTQCSPSSLLLGLLEHFPDVYERGAGGAAAVSANREVDLFHAYLAAVVHLLKNKESEEEDLLRVLWTVYVPVLRRREPDLSILQIQVAEMIADATSVRYGWDAVKESLVPLCLNSLYPTSQLKRESLSVDGLRYVAYSGWQRLEKVYNVISTWSTVKFKDELLSFYAATQLVAILLGSALEAASLITLSGSDEMKINGYAIAPRRFSEDMVSVFLAPALAKLAQPLDDSLRRYAMQNLLPPLLKAAARFGWLDDASPEKRTVETRTSPMQEVWLSCQALLSHGSSHRRDAYMALALFSDFLLPSELASSWTDKSNIKPSGDFDIRDQMEFWEVMKTGLGDADTLTRKRALHIFRRALSSLDSSAAASKNKAGHAASSDREESGNSSAKGLKVPLSTKRSKWAEEEAASLGVAAVKDKMTQVEGWSQRWDAFILLHETLEEYGIHLVEAAWSHQMSLLLQFTKSKGDVKDAAPYWAGAWSQKKSSNVDVNFAWIAVLWQRGFDHTNPQVRRLVMQSFLEFDWERIRKLSSLLPEDFVLGSLLQALDDAVQHRNFGLKGIYSSATSVGAAKFMSAYSASLPHRRRVGFVVRLANGLLSQSRTRPGLMTLAVCLEAAALGSSSGKLRPILPDREQMVPVNDPEMLNSEDGPIFMLELLKNVVENSKRHFNPKYREQVCSHVLRTASALLVLPDVPFSKFAFFLSSFPRELLMPHGSLHRNLMAWICSSDAVTSIASQSGVEEWVLEGLHVMVKLYLKSHGPISSHITDEDVEAWRLEAGRWARLLVFGLVGVNSVLQILSLIEQHALQLYNYGHLATCKSVKVLLLIQSLFKECTIPSDFPSNTTVLSTAGGKLYTQSEAEGKTLPTLITGISNLVLSIMVELNDFARRSAAIFWEHYSDPVILPASVSGKLGGPSQRRLPSTLTSVVLQGVLSVSTVSDCCLWCCSAGRKLDIPESALNFLWQFAWEATAPSNVMTELGAELQLAAYEALSSVCYALSATVHPFFVTAGHASMMRERTRFPLLPGKAELMVDGLIKALLQNVNASALVGALARSRRAVLASHKWSCLDALLSITKTAVSCRHNDQMLSAASNSILDMILQDSIESLESAGDEYLLPLLRCIRWLMQWGILGRLETDDDPDKKYQVMWTLVQSGWSTMADCNKRKVAPIAAFLSAIFHPAIFGDNEMHGSLEDPDEHGPLKWLLNRLIDLGSRSPRTMRLTALHITGLWLMFPGTTIFYMPEIKKLALHGGESVDEELDGEIIESQISAREYATLIESADPELSEEFTNSEMYVRVMVAVMVDKLANLVEDENLKDDAGLVMKTQALNFGRRFLLDLLNAAATDTDLSKELYKKRSAIHRRKVRVWQLLCILSRFLGVDNAAEVTSLLKVCLYRNNMPSVRQYIEAFAVKFYLQFPHLVEESLIPVLYDYNMKAQALSSYVLIAANVLMFTQAPQQKPLLQQIFPAILPFMTSHHHSLRSFTQVLTYKILHRFSKSECLFDINQGTFGEGQCLRAISNYLEGNADCTRMRISIEKHVDAFDPLSMTKPRGLFCSNNRDLDPSPTAEDQPFECVPVAILDQVAHFLTGAREELREAMAADAIALNAERFSFPNGVDGEEPHMKGRSSTIQGQSNLGMSSTGSLRSDLPSKAGFPLGDENDSVPNGTPDIQKKIASLRFNDASAAYDVEEELLISSIESRAKELIRMRGGRQDLIVVASLLGRVPNLAGLARTCEVFKASSLVVADASIAEDRQFQLISVTADQWIPLVEVPEAALNTYLNLKRKEGYSVLGLEQTANSVSIDKFVFPDKVVLVLGRETDGIPVDVIQALDTCVEIPQLGVIRSLNVHVSGAIAIWEYTRQHLNSRTQLGVD
ncbi:unnamed protein product [Calypogeia fissa]